MKKKSAIVGFVSLVSLLLIGGCAPASFVKGQSSEWNTIVLHESISNEYDKCWPKTVDTIGRDYTIEALDNGSGYLRTSWLYGISGGNYDRYCGRIIVKLAVKEPRKVEVKTEAQWLPLFGTWQHGWDKKFNREVFTTLSGHLGRTVPVAP